MMNRESIILVLSLLVAAVISLAVWRYPRLRVKLRLPGFGEGQLSGERGRGDERKVSKTAQAAKVLTTVGGDVQQSHILTAGGALGSGRGPSTVTTVQTDVAGSVKGSEILTVGGDVRLE